MKGSVVRVLTELWIVSVIVLLPSLVWAQELDFDRLSKRDWLTIQSTNFEIVTDLKTKQARLMTEQLEHYATFCSLFLKTSQKSKAQKTKLFVASRSATWENMGLDDKLVAIYSGAQATTPTALINLDSGFGGGFGRASSARADLFKVIAAQQLKGGDTATEPPYWYVEGMSLYLSTYSEKKSKVLIGDLQALQGRLTELFNAGGNITGYDSKQLLNLTAKPRREDANNDSQYASLVNEMYARAFMTMHFFQSTKEYQERLKRYLDILELGDTPESALSKAFNWSFDELDRELMKYSRSRMYARAFQQDQVDKLVDRVNPNLVASVNVEQVIPERALVKYAELLGEMRLADIPTDQKRAFLAKVNDFQVENGEETSVGGFDSL